MLNELRLFAPGGALAATCRSASPPRQAPAVAHTKQQKAHVGSSEARRGGRAKNDPLQWRPGTCPSTAGRAHRVDQQDLDSQAINAF